MPQVADPQRLQHGADGGHAPVLRGVGQELRPDYHHARSGHFGLPAVPQEFLNEGLRLMRHVGILAGLSDLLWREYRGIACSGAG